MFLESLVKACELLAESLLRPLGQIRGPVVSLGTRCQATEAPGLVTLTPTQLNCVIFNLFA